MTPTREEATRMSAETAVSIALGTGLGVLLAAAVIPSWVPSLRATLSGPEPKAFWYLSRASGVVAFVLLWASMLAGLGMSTRLAREWPGLAAPSICTNTFPWLAWRSPRCTRCCSWATAPCSLAS